MGDVVGAGTIRACAECGKVLLPWQVEKGFRLCKDCNDIWQRGSEGARAAGAGGASPGPDRGQPAGRTRGDTPRGATAQPRVRNEIPPGYLTPEGGYLADGYFDTRGHTHDGVLVHKGVLVMDEPVGQNLNDVPIARIESMVGRAVYALSFGRTDARAHAQTRGGLSFVQLHRFYLRVHAIDARLGRAPFEAVKRDLWRLPGLARRAAVRGVVPACFVEFVDTNVALADKDPQSLRDGFKQHLQAVLCFYQYFNPRS